MSMKRDGFLNDPRNIYMSIEYIESYMLSNLIIFILFYILVSRLDCNTWRQLCYVYIIMLSVLLQQCFYKYVPHGIIIVYIVITVKVIIEVG